ncbi:MAG: hypothetical protein RR373_02840 [Akkermansia sp.]
MDKTDTERFCFWHHFYHPRNSCQGHMPGTHVFLMGKIRCQNPHFILERYRPLHAGHQ